MAKSNKIPKRLLYSEAYEDDPDEARKLWDAGFRPIEAQHLKAGQTVAYYVTDMFQFGSVGGIHTGQILSVSHIEETIRGDRFVVGIEACHTTVDGGESRTESDPESEVWIKK